MATAMFPLQGALYGKLTGSTALMALVTGVFDEVPEGQAYPYVSLGSITEVPDDAHDAQGLESMAVVHVWSKYPGNAEAFRIFAEVDKALDRKPLTVTGFRDVSIRLESSEAVKDPDPAIRHINSQYRVRMTRQT